VLSASSSTQESHCLIRTVRHTAGGNKQGCIPTADQHLLLLSTPKVKTTACSQLSPGKSRTEAYLLPGYLLFSKMLEHFISR